MPSPKTQIKDPREELVAQGNDLIRHVRFPLTALEQNVVYFVMSKVKPTDQNFMKQSFTVAEFCEVCGIKPSNHGGANYRTIKAAVKSVADKSAWVEYPNGRESLVRWFDTYDIDRNSGTMTATLSQSIKPYLIGLIERAKGGGEGYTQAHLYNYIAMQSKYSKRLYEILKSYLYSRGGTEKLYKLTYQEYDLEELKQLMNAYNYTRWQDFRRKALESATEEINEITDISVSYSVVKTGRKITGVSFSFQHKKNVERWDAEIHAKKILDSPKRQHKPEAESLADYIVEHEPQVIRK
jgi:plasmid replication initiation protein